MQSQRVHRIDRGACTMAHPNKIWVPRGCNAAYRWLVVMDKDIRVGELNKDKGATMRRDHQEPIQEALAYYTLEFGVKRTTSSHTTPYKIVLLMLLLRTPQ